MKKLYRRGTVHPSPPAVSDCLSFLPAAVLTLAAALSPEDREVLAYLISCSSSNNNYGNFPAHKQTTQKKAVSYEKTVSGFSGNDHTPSFNCDCFRCYMSYWRRWDSSPKRQLIHEIIDTIEEDLSNKRTKSFKTSKKDRKKHRGGCNNSTKAHETCEVKLSEKSTTRTQDSVLLEQHQQQEVDETHGDDDGVEQVMEKGSVRRFVSFIGDKIWGVWGQSKD